MLALDKGMIVECLAAREGSSSQSGVEPRNRDLAHLCPDILKTGRADETEANDEDVGLRITQWT